MLSRSEVVLLWLTDYWDYPREGALELDGKRYWFAEAELDRGIFDIMELSAEDWAIEDARHADIQRYLGTHLDYTEQGNRRPIEVSVKLHESRLRPARKNKKFYAKWADASPMNGPVVAQWRFDEGSVGDAERESSHS